MGQTVSTTAFTYVGGDEPHRARRKEILQKYPQIRDLYGPDIRLLYCVLFLVALQFGLAMYASKMSSLVFFLLAYVIGGTATHALSLANHELSHNLCFETPILNELLGILANCGQG